MGIRGEQKRLETVGVYVHIPFCSTKCSYCDFNSIATDEVPERRYAEAISSELIAVIEARGLEGRWSGVDSLYIGGGTPSLLGPEAISSIIGIAFGNVWGSLSPGAPLPTPPEITIEANPESISEEKLEHYLACGVNRLSLGVQATNDRLLKSIGRAHTSAEALRAFELARRAGFKNIAVDLIFALPGHTLVQWRNTLEQAMEMRPEHISIYGLTIEKNTELGRQVSLGLVTLPEEETTLEMYEEALRTLKGAGYKHYEISNLALPGFESRHNSRYWQGGDYLGLGAGAHSYLTPAYLRGTGKEHGGKKPGGEEPGGDWGARWWNVKDPDRYMSIVETVGTAEASSELLTKNEALTEAVLCGMRDMAGINRSEFQKKFGVAPEEAMDFARLSGAGLVEVDGDYVKLTPKGIIFSNEVF